MLDRARRTAAWTPRAEWAPRTLYMLAAALGIASLLLALWGWRAARTFDDQLTRAASVQAELLAREFSEEVRTSADASTQRVFAELIASGASWGDSTPEIVRRGEQALQSCKCAPVIANVGGTFWWTNRTPNKLFTRGVDSAGMDALRRKLIKTVPAGQGDKTGWFLMKADDDGQELLAPILYRVRGGVAEAVGYLADADQFAASVMLPAAWIATEARFGKTGLSPVTWRVIRPGGDTALKIGEYNPATPALSVAFFRPRFRPDRSAEGPSFVGPAVTDNEVPIVSADASSPLDPRKEPYRLIVQVDPVAVGELLYGTGRGPRLPILILLAVTLSLTAATLLLARRFLDHSRERDAFATAVAHDLRTPLTQILLYGESLQLDRPALRAREEAARVIVRETRRLIHLVENALQFVRGDRASPSLQLRPLDFTHLVSETVHGMRPIFERAGVRIKLDLQPDTWINGDHDALAQVITNLVDNAVRFGPRGQELRIALYTARDRATLDLDDEGPGIPLAMRQDVFKPFVRAGSSQGSGIGLAVSRQLVELMDGALAVSDAPGRGARLTLTLATTTARTPLTSADSQVTPEFVS